MTVLPVQAVSTLKQNCIKSILNSLVYCKDGVLRYASNDGLSPAANQERHPSEPKPAPFPHMSVSFISEW